jgi:hypothetical protein
MSSPEHPFLGYCLSNERHVQPSYSTFALTTQFGVGGRRGRGYGALLPDSTVAEVEEQPRGLGVQHLSTTNGVACRSIDEAEMVALSRILRESPEVGGLHVHHALDRASTNIARHTRRGRANRVLMSRRGYCRFMNDYVQREDFSHFHSTQVNRPDVQGWAFGGDLGLSYSPFTIWVKDCLPDDVAVVAYQGSNNTEAAALLLGHVSRPHLVFNDLGSFPSINFARRVRL